jgi:predicted ABC-type ATPase
MPRRPTLVVIAGPNGAGKSTTAPFLLRDELAVTEFVNADQIAAGLSGFSPDAVALAAGRVMLARLRDLLRGGADFAFESTLASRSLAPFVARAKRAGYRFVLLYLWLESPAQASARVALRVRTGDMGSHGRWWIDGTGGASRTSSGSIGRWRTCGASTIIPASSHPGW